MMGTIGLLHMGLALLLSSTLALVCPAVHARADADGCQVRVDRMPPDVRGGQAYRLIYDIPAPVSSVWQFKTKFDNTFLESNRYILYHRLISFLDNVAITENQYTFLPEAMFRWETRVFPERLRLEFKLLNKGSAHGHRFHYGHIQLNALDGFTRVIQEAYFDFWGSGFWAVYPWHGGMQAFLRYTAQWECAEAVKQMRHTRQPAGRHAEGS